MEKEIQSILDTLKSFTDLAQNYDKSPTAEEQIANSDDRLQSFERKCKEVSSKIDSKYESYDTLVKEEIKLYDSLIKTENELRQKTLESYNLKEKILEREARKQKIIPQTEDVRKQLQVISSITGFSIKDFELIEPQKFKAKLSYNDVNNFYLCFTLEVGTNEFALLDIYPAHENLSAIQKMLEETNDFTGLLCHAREFFKKQKSQAK